MAEEKKAKDVNFHADAQNWEQRIKGEIEAPLKWNETWGELFNRGIPTEYGDRVRYLEEELAKLPGGNDRPPKYGVAPPFKEMTLKTYKRQKMFTGGGEA
jgi:hypothetical protein